MTRIIKFSVCYTIALLIWWDWNNFQTINNCNFSVMLTTENEIIRRSWRQIYRLWVSILTFLFNLWFTILKLELGFEIVQQSARMQVRRIFFVHLLLTALYFSQSAILWLIEIVLDGRKFWSYWPSVGLLYYTTIVRKLDVFSLKLTLKIKINNSFL